MLSSLSATTVTVNLAGVTTGGVFTVSQNAYAGPFSGLPADYFSGGAATTVFGAGTAWTAQFTYDTALLPASIQSNISGLNGADPITTYLLTSASIQWATAKFTIGGFTFSTAAAPLDAPPVPGSPNESTTINVPQAYDSRIAFGDTNFGAQGFHGYSAVASSYNYSNTSAGADPSAHNYSRSGALSFHIYQANDQGALFSGSSVPLTFTWDDTDLPTSGARFGFGFAGFSLVNERFTTTPGGELIIDASFQTAAGADLEVRVTSATAEFEPTDEVPEPGTFFMGAAGAALVALARRRALR